MEVRVGDGVLDADGEGEEQEVEFEQVGARVDVAAEEVCQGLSRFGDAGEFGFGPAFHCDEVHKRLRLTLRLSLIESRLYTYRVCGTVST